MLGKDKLIQYKYVIFMHIKKKKKNQIWCLFYDLPFNLHMKNPNGWCNIALDWFSFMFYVFWSQVRIRVVFIVISNF